MRKSTILWLCLAISAGVILFMTSQHVTNDRQKLSVVEYDIRKEEETLRVLQAEWSYLNQPERLEKLTAEYLTIAPMQGKQFVDIDTLDKTPPPEAPAAKQEIAVAPVQESTKQSEKTPPTKPAVNKISSVTQPVLVPKLETLKPQASSKVTKTAKSQKPFDGAWKPPANKAAWSPTYGVTAKKAWTPPAQKIAPRPTAQASNQKPATQAATPTTNSGRDFNSVIKSLGVQ